MDKLTKSDLLSLEQYSTKRRDFRSRVMAHKKNRRIALGEHINLYFEDRLTMHYQVQEMLRAEKIFEAHGIDEELDTYNPLIPDGANLKATMMIEYHDIDQRQRALASLVGVESKIWIQVQGFEKVYPISDEDLERSDENKTSAVHFLRFEFDQGSLDAAKAGADIGMGVDHKNYRH